MDQKDNTVGLKTVIVAVTLFKGFFIFCWPPYCPVYC